MIVLSHGKILSRIYIVYYLYFKSKKSFCQTLNVNTDIPEFKKKNQNYKN